MKIDFASLTGKRKQNEDKHNIIKNIDGNNKNLLNINFYGIYDGHGGKFVSKFLSENLHKYFMDKRTQYPLKKRETTKAFNYLQKILKDNYHEHATNAGSTCLAIVHFLKNGTEHLNITNVGDCRAIICKSNIAIPLTKDHKPDKPEEEHRIKQLGGEIVWDGYDWRIGDLSVSRAFGDISAEPHVSCEPEIFEYVLSKNDKFLIMGCDGVWDVMDNQEACDFVIKHCYNLTTGEKINDKINMAKKLADRAIEKGSTDNISVIIVFFN